MFYFKTINIKKSNNQEIENTIRKYALKRNFSLDLSFSTSDINEHKLFLGLEDEKTLKFTRIRTSFERILPKIILKFDKTIGFTKFKVRFCLITSFLLCLIILSSLFSIYNSIQTKQLESDLYDSFFLLLIFFLLTLLEIYITKSRINKILNNEKIC